MFKKLKDIKKDLNENKQLRLIKKNYIHIRNISNPTKKIQLEAIKQDFNAIIHIENPTKKAIVLATRGIIEHQDLP